MKGFFAFVLQAISELDEKQQTQPILILATADEETTMAGAQQICKHPNLKPDPKSSEGGTIEVASLVLTFDHRWINGVGAASFLSDVRKGIEQFDQV